MVVKLLDFNPERRLDIDASLKHPYMATFVTGQEPSCPGRRAPRLVAHPQPSPAPPAPALLRRGALASSHARPPRALAQALHPHRRRPQIHGKRLSGEAVPAGGRQQEGPQREDGRLLRDERQLGRGVAVVHAAWSRRRALSVQGPWAGYARVSTLQPSALCVPATGLVSVRQRRSVCTIRQPKIA